MTATSHAHTLVCKILQRGDVSSIRRDIRKIFRSTIVDYSMVKESLLEAGLRKQRRSDVLIKDKFRKTIDKNVCVYAEKLCENYLNV